MDTTLKAIRRLLAVVIMVLPLMAAAQDSVRVESLLREGIGSGADGGNLVVYYAERLLGMPYVAQTLETDGEERLVVNMREMDCTTLVETCVALSLTTRQGSTAFGDYKKNLTLIRYRNGRLDGYASRNHYFSQWIRSNEGLGIVEEVSEPTQLFSAQQTIDLHYMSDHTAAYPMLRGDTMAQRLIRKYERQDSGETVGYIPKSKVAGGKDGELGTAIRDGDILALVTSKDGLDTSHIGIAVWRDGRLHLLNASQIHKKVVLEPMTLHEYMQKHPTQLGVRVIRVK